MFLHFVRLLTQTGGLPVASSPDGLAVSMGTRTVDGLPPMRRQRLLLPPPHPATGDSITHPSRHRCTGCSS